MLGRPYSAGGGKTVHVRLQRLGGSEAQMVRTCGAHEKVSVSTGGPNRVSTASQALGVGGKVGFDSCQDSGLSRVENSSARILSSPSSPAQNMKDAR